MRNARHEFAISFMPAWFIFSLQNMHHEPWQPHEILWNPRGNFFKLELIFSVVLISAVQQGDSGIHIYIHILVHIFSHGALHACCALSHIWVFVMLWTVVHGILQARTVEWVAMPFSRGSSRPRDWTRVSSSAGELFNTEPPEKSIIVPPRIFSIVPCFSILYIIVCIC